MKLQTTVIKKSEKGAAFFEGWARKSAVSVQVVKPIIFGGVFLQIRFLCKSVLMKSQILREE